MRWRQAHIFTLRDAPADAEIESHKLLIRAGLIRKLAPGIYSYMPSALRAIRKIEATIREELNSRGCSEILMPMVQPKEIWEETGRWDVADDVLLTFQNRNKQWFALGPTHEEVITDIIRKDIRSYRDLPRNLYQIQTKYRDEIRPRFGLMRGREFIMKDAYSFDVSREKALEAYKEMYQAYMNIFTKLGLNFRVVSADSGNIGGDYTHEFQVLAESGEDHLLVCDAAGYAANVEVAPVAKPVDTATAEAELEKEYFDTPGIKTIASLADHLKCSEADLVKTLFFEGPEGNPICVVLRGSDEVNPIKLRNALGMETQPMLLTDEEVKSLTGAGPGSCGPQGIKADVYVDYGLIGKRNWIVGANKDDVHVKNVNAPRDFEVKEYLDVRMARAGDFCPVGPGGVYESFRGIEVGQVFYLGTKYSEVMGAAFLDAEGKSRPIEMGCYGIGVTRTLQAAIEQNHDEKGIVWPAPLAPFDVHVCLLDPGDKEPMAIAEDIENLLEGSGFAVLVDDREERPGVKFNDADLLGFPLRVVVGRRGLEKGVVEVVERATGEKHEVSKADIATFLQKWLNGGGA